MIPRRTLLAALAAIVVQGCGASAPEPEEAPSEPSLPELPALPMLIPDGAHTVLVAQPAELMGAQAFRTVIDAVVAPEIIDSFERRTGVIPAEVTEAVVAEVGDDGFVLIARGPFPARDVVRAAEMRMNTVEARQDEPFFRRVGYLGADLRDVVALGDDVVMVAGGAPDVVATILARAERGSWSEDRRPALAGPDVAPLLEAYGDAPLVLYVPEPLELPEGFGASLLLAENRAMAASVRPEGDDRLAFTVELVGELPAGAEDNLRTWVQSMGRSPLGGALGISEAARTLSIQLDDRSAVLRAQVASDTLAAGLRVLFVAQLEELLGAAPSAR